MIDPAVVKRHLAILRASPEFGKRVARALERKFEKDSEPECQLYDGFIPEGDKAKMATVRSAKAVDLKGFDPGFSDKRLQAMLMRYKARNYPSSLTDDERAAWEEHRHARLEQALPRFIQDIQAAAQKHTDPDASYTLEELRLYAESIMP